MTWPIRATYDQRIVGTAETTFTRNVATVDDTARPVAANKRRYHSQPVGVCGYVDWQASNIDMGTNADVLGSGPDSDGTALVVTRNNVGQTIIIYTVDQSNGNLTQASSTAFSALPGVAGNITYQPRSCWVYYGLVVM